MIIHICGNLASGKTTAAEALQRRLGWPMVPVGRMRNRLCDEDWLWRRAVPRLWRAWDFPLHVPGRSGIWVSTGFNWRELVAWESHAPRFVFRVWLTAPVDVLRQRFYSRPMVDEGYWPYLEEPMDLFEGFLRYDIGDAPVPWPIDLSVDTGLLSTDRVVDRILEGLTRIDARESHQEGGSNDEC
ncbi:hypothetical protein TPY_2751 [Sulfobacillus acidophilus TPY]|uniref:Uncharacterized protein n=1 Tax=Sulfobacillus acidophilus (strain ATCC 700253 / DSM 10332 / NAL) TaxID=679936 RepID=G8TUI3_SULAD|nr:hypothetical protein TPY_2751 [Sulfobacillus acidophilus TPY]AEW04630.1 hypothetical protein Sulac_1130 [Sulfobacillus acidophilus DSM 10332]